MEGLCADFTSRGHFDCIQYMSFTVLAHWNVIWNTDDDDESVTNTTLNLFFVYFAYCYVELCRCQCIIRAMKM